MKCMHVGQRVHTSAKEYELHQQHGAEHIPTEHQNNVVYQFQGLCNWMAGCISYIV